jgi:hypothetical protein
MMWFDLEEEIVTGGHPSMAPIWFSTVPSLQQPFNHDCCIYRKELFTEFLCICTALCGPGIGPACLWFFWDHGQSPLLAVWSFWTGSRSCYCSCTAFHHLGFVVGALSPFVFFM